jgi:hypothetical protein
VHANARALRGPSCFTEAVHGLPWLSAQYCARQNATAFLELWGLLLVLCGAAAATLFAARRLGSDRQFAARFCAGALLLFALLTGILAASTFYGCTATAASEQGLTSDLPAGTFTVLRCLGTSVLGMVNGWVLLVVTSIAAIALVVLGIFRQRAAVRVPAFAGATLLVILAFAFGFFLLFGFSWCESQRLI